MEVHSPLYGISIPSPDLHGNTFPGSELNPDFPAIISGSQMLDNCSVVGADIQPVEEDLMPRASNAATRLQKAYRGHRIRRMVADYVFVADKLWWQAIDYARLNLSTISFVDLKHESASSRWSRVSLNASKVGKGLSKDAKAQILAFQHWIEAIDPRHRYGHNLHFYYDEWCKADDDKPFFYWLDVGGGKVIDLKECPRSKLRQQCIKYLGPQERENFEYIVVQGRIVHKQHRSLLDTTTGLPGPKWIFVMSTSKELYAGVKKKGKFHHSSFLAGGATLAAGRLEVQNGILKSVSKYSGHYCPTDENLEGFTSFLKDNGVNLEDVKIHKPTDDSDSYDDGIPSGSEGTIKISTVAEDNEPEISKEESVPSTKSSETTQPASGGTYNRTLYGGLQSPRAELLETAILQRINSEKAAKCYQLGHQLSLKKLSTGAGARIGCVADCPVELRRQALEMVNLSPRTPNAPLPLPAYRQSSTIPLPTAEPILDMRAANGN